MRRQRVHGCLDGVRQEAVDPEANHQQDVIAMPLDGNGEKLQRASGTGESGRKQRSARAQNSHQKRLHQNAEDSTEIVHGETGAGRGEIQTLRSKHCGKPAEYQIYGAEAEEER